MQVAGKFRVHKLSFRIVENSKGKKYRQNTIYGAMA